MMKKWAIAGFSAILIGTTASAGACDNVQLQTNMQWSYDNNAMARSLIQEAMLIDNPPAAYKKIRDAYSQSQRGDPLKHLENCGPLDLIRAARAITGM